MLVHHFLESSARDLPDKIALVEEERYTYGELDTLSGALAAYLLSEGLNKGDRVAIQLDNGMPAAVSIMGVLKAGGAFMPLHPTTKKDKLEYILKDSGAMGLISTADHLSDVGNMTGLGDRLTTLISVARPEDGHTGGGHADFHSVVGSSLSSGAAPGIIDLDLASVVYTSGSTGVPKGVTLTHRNMVAAAESITTYLANTPQDVILNILPISFDYGLYQILMSMKIGGRVVLDRSFNYPYQILKKVQEEEVTGLPGTPSIFNILSRMKTLDQMEFPHLRYMTSTGAVMPDGVLKRIRKVFPGVLFYSMYGLTECKRVSFLAPDQIDQRPRSVGKGMPNEEVFVLRADGSETAPGEVGELVVRGSNVMAGYWDDEVETARVLRPGRYPWEKHLYTGDLFKRDEEDYLYFVARKDDLIKCREGRVSPREIEDVLARLPDVVDCAVIGVPHDIFGMTPQAHLVLTRTGAVAEKEVISFCSSHLENFMVPGSVVFHEQLPRTTSGKIDRKALSENS